MTIQAWGQGHKYSPDGPQIFQGSFTPASRPQGLLDGGKYYSISKPQYENLSSGDFISARGAGATGDGTTDDTRAVQGAINTAVSQNKVVFFEHGVYKVTQTIYVPPGARMVGETFSTIMASGGTFSNKDNPVPVVQIGEYLIAPKYLRRSRSHSLRISFSDHKHCNAFQQCPYLACL